MTRLLHMIGNAHIDPVWLWQWPEGYQEVHATFRSALDRMDEYPDFVFTCDSVVFFQWVEESDPELFARIRERIAEGRWQVIGGWWVEPDCNIPGGESYVRQALYGQRYLRDRFGITATTGANIDSFGHNAMLPQLLRGSGMDSYVFLRPGPRERELPTVFRWESPDGSRVLAYRIPHEYCAPRDDLGEHVEKALAELPADHDELMVFYGVGNHGGGPTKANLDSIARLSESGELPRLELSSVRRYFDSVGGNGDLPVLANELQHHGVGCYTAHSGIKRWNRRAEHLLLRAEKWCAVADVLGVQAYPHEQLTEAWKLLLFNQFHDTLAGTSIEPAYEDARDQLGHVSSLASLAFNRAVQSIARRIDVPHEDRTKAVVVFNPHPWRLRADVELEYYLFRKEGARLDDDAGEPVPLQLTRPLTTMSAERVRFVFPVDVAPLGYRTYRLYEGERPLGPALRTTETSLENDQVLLELDPATGRIARLVHKASGADLAARRLAPRGRRRGPLRHVGPRRPGVRPGARRVRADLGPAAGDWAGAGDSSRREPLGRVDAARGLRARRERRLRRCARRDRLARAAEAAEAPVPDERRGRGGHVRGAVRPSRATGRRATRSRGSRGSTSPAAAAGSRCSTTRSTATT